MSMLLTLGLGNLAQYPINKVYMVLGAWIAALVFAIVAIVDSDTVILSSQAATGAIVETKTKKQYKCNLFGALTLLMLVATFYFALQLL